MGIKLMIAAVIGIIGSIILAAGVLIFAKDSGGVVAATDAAAVKVDQYAPESNVDPMNPVASDEADRRATLHGELAVSARKADNDATDESSGAYVAAPVVERVGDLGDPNDPLARKLYGDALFSSEPTNGDIEVVTPKPAPVRPPRPTPVRKTKPTPGPTPVAPAVDPATDLLKRAGDLGKLRVVTDRLPPDPTIEIVQKQ